jgi:hypothetical protein
MELTVDKQTQATIVAAKASWTPPARPNSKRAARR